MGSLLHLQDAHERAQLLLPWHVNGTLEEAETALLEAHLAECAECRADLAAERSLRSEIASLPMPELARPPGAIRAPAGAKLRPPMRRHFLARRISLGWAIAGQAAVAAAVALFLLFTPAGPGPDASYRLLGSDANEATGNVIVMFAPDATERQLRAALEQAGGRMVDGPTASGAYLVRVTPSGRPAALERLRGMEQVVLAEPVDGGASQ